MEKIVSQALQPGSHIENPDSAKMTASFELTSLVKGGLTRHNGKGEYAFISRKAYELVLNDFSRVGGEFVAPSRNAQPLRNEAKQMTD